MHGAKYKGILEETQVEAADDLRWGWKSTCSKKTHMAVIRRRVFVLFYLDQDYVS